MSLLAKIGEKGRQHGPASVGQRQTVGTRATIPAPTKGLNTRDAFAAMKPDYAIVLDNYFPDHGAVRLRAGHVEHADGVGSGYVESLIPHYSGTVAKFFAIGGGSMHEITDGGTVGAAVKDMLTGNIWDHATVSGSTILVNGADDPMRIEPAGTLAAAHGWTVSSGTLPVLLRVMAFKNRLFFVEKDTAEVWYGPLNGVQGQLTGFDFSFVAPEGGNVLELGTMTLDAGEGVDDFFLVFLQHGVVLVYQGIDPASAVAGTGFSIVGRFKIGALVGDRPLVNVGGDLIALTVDGAVSLSQILKRGRSGQGGLGLTDTIAPTFRDRAALYGANAGWDSILHPPASWLMFSLPGPGGEQYVMNTQTGAWCRFTGMDARCWGRFRDQLYFGGPGGKVFRANVGLADDDNPIEGDVQTAYNYFRTPQEKRITMTRSVVEADASIQFQLGSTTDFGVTARLAAPSSIVTTGTKWATAFKATGNKWATASKQTGNKWAAGRVQLRSWQVVNQGGTALSIRLRSATKGANIALYATDVIYERAEGIL